MTDNPITSGDAVRAANRLIAAAILHRQAIADGTFTRGDVTRSFVQAADAYLIARTPLDAARDRALLDRMSPSYGHPRYLDRPDPVRQAIAVEARASVALDGDTIDVGPVRLVCTDTWILPGGTVVCPRHIDGCPPAQIAQDSSGDTGVPTDPS